MLIAAMMSDFASLYPTYGPCFPQAIHMFKKHGDRGLPKPWSARDGATEPPHKSIVFQKRMHNIKNMNCGYSVPGGKMLPIAVKPET
ncbi:MAG: hypothetical protein ABR522_12005, partial [Marinobacter sp.]